MRTSFSLILLLALALSGCAGKKTTVQRAKTPPRAVAPGANSASATNQTMIVKPANPLVGKVAFVNPTARFVVLNFPLGNMAAVDKRLDLYRRGLKVGEVKVTGPAREDNIVADLVAGEAEVGDEARSQ